MSAPERTLDAERTHAANGAAASLSDLPVNLRFEVERAIPAGAEVNRVAIGTAAAVVMTRRLAEAALLVPLVHSGERAFEAQAIERREAREAKTGRRSGRGVAGSPRPLGRPSRVSR